MILIFEMIMSCILFTAAVILGRKKDPLSGLHNMPISLQERVSSLAQYKDVKVIHTKERILKKLPALFMLAVLLIVLIYASGARNFSQGFINTFLLWVAIKLYVVFALDCIWLSHTPSAWIPGTEDLKDCYQDYSFYIRSIPRSIMAGLLVALVVGLVIEII